MRLRVEAVVEQLPTEISFDRWVQHVFDHPILDPPWWFHSNDEVSEDWWAGADRPRTLEYVTRLFQAPAFLLGTYTHPQIDQGLLYIVSPSCSDHMFVLQDAALPWERRRDCIHAMCTLYAELMAPLYQDDLGHTNRRDPKRPNRSCYMWWDAIPLCASLEHPDIDRMNEAVLHVFRETLKLRSEACLESVLHGIGHYHFDIPDQVAPIIDEFLATRHDISPTLRKYAELAAEGAVQ